MEHRQTFSLNAYTYKINKLRKILYEAEAEGTVQVQDQPGLHIESLSPKPKINDKVIKRNLKKNILGSNETIKSTH